MSPEFLALCILVVFGAALYLSGVTMGRLRAVVVLERLRGERVGTSDFDVLTEAIRRVSA